jgi:citrate lyase subunit beta-like protein
MSAAARRPRRALLFVPGTEGARIEKAARTAADTVIIDLEDAAATSRKAEARAITIAALAAVDFGSRERCVRINPIGSGLEDDDLDALSRCDKPPDCVMLPKTEDATQVRKLAARLDAIEAAHGATPGTIRILALVETALGVVSLREIATSDPRLDGLCFGAEDLCGDIGAQRSAAGDEIVFAKRSLVIHAAAARLQAIDTPYVALTDVEGLIADTRGSLALGYTGRLAVHPRQVDPILAVFTPTAEEIAAARRLVGEHDRHQAAGKGVFELDGRMIDMPMVRAAQTVLHRARNAGAMG